MDYDFEIKSIIQYYAQWVREGKLKVNSDWNKDLKIKFTVQDPCQLVRKSFRRSGGRRPALCGQSGGGRGEFRRHDAQPLQQLLLWRRRRVSAVRVTRKSGGSTANSKPTRSWPPGAEYCITPCHNCHAQVHDLADIRDHAWQTVHLWTLICLSLGVLGPNERAYLGDDLKDVDVFHPESAM